MSEAPQHTPLDGMADYIAALDALCGQARRELLLFEKNCDGLGFNSEARYGILRAFLLADPANRLHVLAHDPRYLAQDCPRMTMLLRQFGHAVHIHRTPRHLQHLTEPFAIADESAYVRRFHFDDPRGILAVRDAEGARTLKSRFAEMWAASHPAVSATTLGL